MNIILEILLATLVVIFGWLSYYVYKQFTFLKVRGIPQLPPSFPMGNIGEIGRTKAFFDILRDVYTKFKGTSPIAGFSFLFAPSYMILDLDLIKNILIKDFSNFSDKGFFHNEKDDPLSGHLFALDGEKWRNMRHKLSPTFTSGKMKFMFPTVVGVSNRLIEVISSTIETDPIIEIKDVLARFTTDIIGTCAFGIECNSLKDPDTEFNRRGNQMFTDHRHSQFVEALMFMYPKPARALKMKYNPEHVSEFFLKVVRENIDYREKNNIKRNDFFNLLLEIKNSSSMKMEELAAQCFVFFLAGFETSSSTMGFCLYELAFNQDMQEKLREEIQEGLKKNNGELSYETMKEMKYLEQVVKETLRKYSILPNLVRMPIEDYPVPNSNFVIEKGVSLVIPVDAIMNDPEIYPDPEKFDPERFTRENIESRHQMTWLPFGDGPRNCIGLRFGKMQTYIGLIALLSKFKFSITDKTEKKLVYDLKSPLRRTMNGIFLKVEKI
ncbi:hypothetical protein ACFFRR_011635 [Megaselia abdita]